MTRPPTIPQPQPCDLLENGGNGRAGQVIHYPADIQPIFDANCLNCHGPGTPDGGLNLSGTITTYYSTSYEELARKELAGPIIPEFTSFRRGDQGNYHGAALPPNSLGSPKSALIDILTNPSHPKNVEDDHSRMLTDMEVMILSRWVDTNYQFYGTYYGRHHPRWTGPDPDKPSYRPADFRRKPSFEEAIDVLAPEWHR